MGEHQDPGYFREEKNEQIGITGTKVVTGCGLGCLAIVLAVLALIGYALFSTQKKVDRYANKYFSDFPVQFDYPDIQMSDIDLINERFNNFMAAQKIGYATEPLILSSDEINILINHHESFQLLAEQVRVEFVDNRLFAEASIKIDMPKSISIPFVNKALKNKYLHGRAEVDLSIYNGLGTLYIRDFQISEAKLPQQFIDNISNRNWLSHTGLDPKLKQLLNKIGELKIEDNKLYFIPGAPNRSEPETNDSKPTIIRA